MIFSESVLHEKQTSGEHPRQNVNDTEGDPRDHTCLYTAREPVNLIQTSDKRATDAITQEKTNSRSAQLAARHHHHANSNHGADNRYNFRMIDSLSAQLIFAKYNCYQR